MKNLSESVCDYGMTDTTPRTSPSDCSSGSILSNEPSIVVESNVAEAGRNEMASKMKKKPTTNGRKKRVVRPYADLAREYQELMDSLGLNQLECGQMFDYAGRTARRYKRGEGKVPLSTLKLMRLMARGILTKRQVMQA